MKFKIPLRNNKDPFYDRDLNNFKLLFDLRAISVGIIITRCDEQYDIIEACSWGPFLELFARGPREGWVSWGNQADQYSPDWATYKNHSQSKVLMLPFRKATG